MFNLFQYFKNINAQKKYNKRLNKPVRSLLKFKQLYPNYRIGRHCYGVPNIKFQHENALLSIGAYCSIAKNVQIFMGGIHRGDWVTTYPFHAFFKEAAHIKNAELSNGDVLIGNDVWLCENVTILSGVSIGDGAVIANGAVVTKNVAPYEIVGGNPAKHIRWRFDEETRAALLATTWWSWSDEEVLSVVDLICSSDIGAFLQYAANRKK